MTTHIVDTHDVGLRLDLFVAQQYPSVSRTKIQRCIEQGGVLCNNRHARKRLTLKEGDEVAIDDSL